MNETVSYSKVMFGQFVNMKHEVILNFIVILTLSVL
jgi:hypothetical protein